MFLINYKYGIKVGEKKEKRGLFSFFYYLCVLYAPVGAQPQTMTSL